MTVQIDFLLELCGGDTHCKSELEAEAAAIIRSSEGIKAGSMGSGPKTVPKIVSRAHYSVDSNPIGFQYC